MKLKCRPDDFVVTENVSTGPATGVYSLYCLSKTDIGTLEALQQIGRVWNLPAWRIAHAGLKDRHAVTHQSITIRNGPRTNLQQKRFSVSYLRQTELPLAASSLRSNRFRIVVRRLTADHACEIVDRASDWDGLLIPNYFDEQRFGSLGVAAEYVAVAWCRRDYERATWLALADANRHERPDDNAQREILRDHWGDWLECKRQLNRSHRRSIVTYLVDHPQGFRRAFGLVRPELRGLYLSAFQSAVWNRMLGMLIRQMQPGWAETGIADSQLAFGMLTRETVSSVDQTLPLVSARVRNLTQKQQTLADAATALYGLRVSEMKVAYPRDRFFSRGNRRCWLSPTDMTAQVQADELYSGFQSVTLEFELPPGCYATMLVRGLTERFGGHHR